MTHDRVRLHVLCEDDLHKRFAERLAERWGIGGRQRIIEAAPRAQNARQFVLNNYAKAVRRWRAQKRENVVLLVIIDGDRSGVAASKRELANVLQAAGVDGIEREERVAHFIPTWHLETWIIWLVGCRPVDESARYKTDADDPGVKQIARRIESGEFTARLAVDRWQPPLPDEAKAVPSLADARREEAQLRVS